MSNPCNAYLVFWLRYLLYLGMLLEKFFIHNIDNVFIPSGVQSSLCVHLSVCPSVCHVVLVNFWRSKRVAHNCPQRTRHIYIYIYIYIYICNQYIQMHHNTGPHT